MQPPARARYEVNTYWTNLPGCDEVIALYHAHGTSEQFHSELKSDMGVEQLPSGKFCVNRLVLLCAMIAFKLLRTIGQQAIKRAHPNQSVPLATAHTPAKHHLLRRACLTRTQAPAPLAEYAPLV